MALLWSSSITKNRLMYLVVMVKIKTNKQQIQELLLFYFPFQTLYVLTYSTVVKFAYYVYI